MVPSSSGVLAVAAAVLVALVAAVGYAAGRRGPTTGSSAPVPAEPPPSTDPGSVKGGGSDGPWGVADRAPAPRGCQDLVAGLVGAHDLAAGNRAVRAHVEQVLRRAGVRRIPVAVGDPFDPDLHVAVALEPAGPGPQGAARESHVAREVRPGWADGTTTVRPAEVAVWTA